MRSQTFSITAIISMVVVMLITAVETTGDVHATGEFAGKRIKRADIAAALRAGFPLIVSARDVADHYARVLSSGWPGLRTRRRWREGQW